MYTLIRRLVLRPLIWVYTVCKCPFYGTLDINELNGICILHKIDKVRLLLYIRVTYSLYYVFSVLSYVRVICYINEQSDVVVLVFVVLRFYGPVNPMGSCRARSV